MRCLSGKRFLCDTRSNQCYMTSGGAHLATIDADTACRALAAAERRVILDYLLTAETNVVGFEVIARHVKSQQGNTDTEADTDPLGMIVLELLHQHLPHLEAAGLIDFDSRSETIAATDGIESLRPVLEALETL